MLHLYRRFVPGGVREHQKTFSSSSSFCVRPRDVWLGVRCLRLCAVLPQRVETLHFVLLVSRSMIITHLSDEHLLFCTWMDHLTLHEDHRRDDDVMAAVLTKDEWNEIWMFVELFYFLTEKD